MPVFMDVHNVEGGVAASDVAAAHEADLAAERQHAVVAELFQRKLGVRPGIAVEQAMRESRQERDVVADGASLEAIVESGAAVAAGAVETGVRSLRTAVRLADRASSGRVHLLTGALGPAAACLDESIRVAESHHWLAFLPWPQALRGETSLASDDPAAATRILQQAFARACQIGDPCWEGMAARSLALVAEAAGETSRAFELLADARTRSNRLADPYVWLDAHILDTQCELGRRHGHPDVKVWADALRRLASRTGMRELTVRAMRHSSDPGDHAAAELLAGDVSNGGQGRNTNP